MKRNFVFILISLFIFFKSGFAATLGVQVGSFEDLKNAVSTVFELNNRGYDCSYANSDEYYKVFCRAKDNREALSLKKKLESAGYRDAFLVALSSTGPEAQPMGVEKGEVTAGVFERKGGYIHPFLSLSGYWTDNVYNTNDDKKSDYVAVITPGIWFTVPRVKEQMPEVETLSIVPGGMTVGRLIQRYPRRYQTYLLYQADIEQFKKYSSENFINHKLEGMLQYNMRGGLSIDLLEQFLRSHDTRGTGLSRELDKFHTNLLGITLTYDTANRLQFRLEYKNYLVNYTQDRNDFRDRTDHSVSGYVFYKFLPKTSAFVEYDFIKVEYKQAVLPESEEHHLYGGVQWNITAKSKGRIKVGYGAKDFKDSSLDTNKELILEAQVDHKFTPKTSLKLIATRRTNETNISATDFIISNALRGEYLQRLTSKITGSVGLSYQRDKYRGELTLGGETKERKDDIYGASIAFAYEFKEWLKAEAGYIYTKRDSNFSDFDFTNNTVFLRLTGSM